MSYEQLVESVQHLAEVNAGLKSTVQVVQVQSEASRDAAQAFAMTALATVTEVTGELLNADQVASAAAEVKVEQHRVLLATPEGATTIGFSYADEAALLLTLADVVSLPVRPEFFGVNLDTTDASAAIIKAITVADATGRGVDLVPGKKYLIKAGVNTVDKNVVLNFNGASLVRATDAANVPVFSVKHTMGASRPVTALTLTTFDYSGEGSLSDVHSVGLVDLSGFAVGDFVKIASDDLNPSSPTADNERLGEIFEIGALGSGVLYTLSALKETYTTNIRVSKMTKKRCQITGLDATDLPGYPSSRGSSLVYFESVIEPVLYNAKVYDGAGIGIHFKNCYKPKTFNACVDRLRTFSASSAFGYGIYETGCMQGRHYNLSGSNMRHVYTTGTISSSAGAPDLTNHGAVIESEVHNGVATNSENAAWDTHADSLRVRFVNCTVSGKPTGVGNSRFGIQLRGRGDEAVSCKTDGPGAIAFRITNDHGYRFKVTGHKHRIAANQVQTVGVFGLTGLSTARVRADIEAEVDFSGAGLISAVYADFNCNIKAKAGVTSVASLAPVRLDSASTMTGSLDLDLTQVTGTNPRVIKTVDALSSARMDRIAVKRADTATWYIGDLTAQDGTIDVGVLETTHAQAAANGGFISPGGAAIYGVAKTVIDRIDLDAGVTLLTNAAITLSAVSRRINILDVPLTAARQVTLPTSGLRIGMRLVFIRSANATGAFDLLIGSVTTLSAVNTSATIYWSGTAWVKL